MRMRGSVSALALWIILGIAACQPRVEIAAPKEPITINLNVKIEHEIKVKVDRDLDNLFQEDSSLF